MSYVFYTVFLHNKARKKMIKNLKEKTFTVLIGKKKDIVKCTYTVQTCVAQGSTNCIHFPFWFED